jgi:hypothetical protein
VSMKDSTAWDRHLLCIKGIVQVHGSLHPAKSRGPSHRSSLPRKRDMSTVSTYADIAIPLVLMLDIRFTPQRNDGPS